jgi:hypothetical protein
MDGSPLTSVFDRWTHPSYERRVRGASTPPSNYLWGSAGITNNIPPFDKPLILHIRNDLFGDAVTFGTLASGVQTEIGTLQPGECVSIPLQNISGVYATCPTESVIACLIRE